MKKSSLFFLVLFITSLSSYAEESVQVTNAWINEAPPMAKSLAGYMEIHNRTDKSIMLRSITSPNFELAEFHKTEIQDGMARMTPVSQVVIKPHSKISFEPGGLHMMLINPRKEIKKGEKIEITLHFPNDKELTFTAKVKK
ncbi:copper chaperone PCu(A)C [Kaarinaea lacus]